MPRPKHAAPRPAAAPFLRAEEGSLTIFGLVMFMLMMIGAGIALDAMRSEVDRTELQYTIDRAVLAAAGRDQLRAGEVIVEDYMRAAGIDRDAFEITATDTFGTRTVTVTAQARTPTLFMDLLGIDMLVQPVSTQAREVETELELSLVLDISGSMADPVAGGGAGTKIAALRQAADDFVTELLTDREDETYVSLVPYNGWVNAGSILPSYFPLTTEHDYSRCVVFEDADYTRTAFGNNAVLQRKGHFSMDGYLDTHGPVPNPDCTVGNYAEVLPWSNDVTELQRRIDLLRADGSTATQLGVKIGTMLLDPSVRPRLQAMANDTSLAPTLRVDRDFVGRPLDYDTDGANKVLVVMTDGQNDTQRDLVPSRKSGMSPIWIAQDRRNSTCDDNGDPRSCPDRSSGGGRAAPDNGLGTNGNSDVDSTAYRVRYSLWSPGRNRFYHVKSNTHQTTVWGRDEARQLPWTEVFANISLPNLYYGIFKNADVSDRQFLYDSWTTTHFRNERADDNLSAICAAARAQGVVVYTIAFNAPPGGQNAMRDCVGAEHASRYFDVAGLDIDVAFDDILASVTRLRLYQ